mmetsp:Transcript_15350/g.33313  ORF Transcript_15350/g.33313 Transcript_15350/m.33313 type:complete len:222 (+) Transcript_15350:202-867(+)
MHISPRVAHMHGGSHHLPTDPKIQDDPRRSPPPHLHDASLGARLGQTRELTSSVCTPRTRSSLSRWVPWALKLERGRHGVGTVPGSAWGRHDYRVSAVRTRDLARPEAKKVGESFELGFRRDHHLLAVGNQVELAVGAAHLDLRLRRQRGPDESICLDIEEVPEVGSEQEVTVGTSSLHDQRLLCKDIFGKPDAEEVRGHRGKKERKNRIGVQRPVADFAD